MSQRHWQLKAPEHSGNIMYWMSRDQRAHDNHALLLAAELATKAQATLHVAFCLIDEDLGDNKAHRAFMLKGLKETAEVLREHGIPFHFVEGNPQEVLPSLVDEHAITHVVADFQPLRWHRAQLRALLGVLSCGITVVDAHNIVPCWVASDKHEFGAYTLRPKIHRQLSNYLTPFQSLPTFASKVTPSTFIVPDLPLPLEPGPHAAKKQLAHFIAHKLQKYATKRNDPNGDATSGLSPYLHYGQISAQTVALAIQNSEADQADKDAFLEELIVRRELSDNHCFYEATYDTFEGIPKWAQTTLNDHANDIREALYDYDDFAQAKTHDPLWNAAQIELRTTGVIHGYMRMYWAKKILEWSKSPQEAIAIANKLNDGYAFDGRDPNGYVGVLWAIGGLHDRAWAERQVYGKIRYMNSNGARRKFDVDAYIERFKSFKDE